MLSAGVRRCVGASGRTIEHRRRREEITEAEVKQEKAFEV